MSRLILTSPLAGWCAPLDEAPDEVFAGRMLGDGVAIDPTGSTLHAPCDGEVILLPASKHAVTLRADGGAEILLHVGIDTVALAGQGFTAHVKEGARVRAGEPLISFDLDWVAQRAKSLLTPVILTSSGYSVAQRMDNRKVSVGDVLMEWHSSAAVVPLPERGAETGGDARLLLRQVAVAFETGIHARPAARIASAVKPYQAVVSIVAGDKKADARSAVALMSLGVGLGDVVTVQASGTDAAAALSAIEAVLLAGEGAVAGGGTRPAATVSRVARVSTLNVGASRFSGDQARREPQRPADFSRADIQSSDRQSASSPVALNRALTTGVLTGVTASRGLAVGTAVYLERREFEITESGAGPVHERSALAKAHAQVRSRLQIAAGTYAGNAGGVVEASGAVSIPAAVTATHSVAREIAEAHLAFLEDPALTSSAENWIALGKSAGHAWREATRESAALLQATGDARMAERVDDLLDLEGQMLAALSGEAAGAGQSIPERSIILARELLPSQLVALNADNIAGICTAGGGPTSHVAIIAAAMNVPAIVAMGDAVLAIPRGTPLVLDADNAVLRVAPPPTQLAVAEEKLEARRLRRVAERDAARRECRTRDGERIEVFANVGSLADALVAADLGAEGCGLLRTEFLFLERRSPPDEHEQARCYQEIATALNGTPLVIRTLDIGGDKPIPYLPLPHEENPALGLRGIRTSLWQPELLRTQLRAVLRVEPRGQCRLLLPMITNPSEVITVRRMLDEAREATRHRDDIELGVMVETPAAALLAGELARDADFFSIGTNDLTQYTLAMDRGHPELAPGLDGLHPAVLRLIGMTADAARVANRPVAVCGGLASDPMAVPILIGLGVTELSAVPAFIPELKALISELTLDECCELAQEALLQESANAVRALRGVRS